MFFKYEPRHNEITGDVLASIFLSAVKFRWDGKPFYKFNAPCDASEYRHGDSWTEELGFTLHQLRKARSLVATKVKTYHEANELLKNGSDEPKYLIFYWTHFNKTHYQLNEKLYKKLFSTILNGEIRTPKIQNTHTLNGEIRTPNTKNTKNITKNTKNDDVVSSPIQPDDKFLSFSPAHNAMKDCGVSEYMIDELITKYGEDDCLHAAKFAMANGNYPAAMCVHSLKKGWRGDLDPKPMDPKPKTLAKPKTTLTWGNVVIDEMSRNNTDDKRGKYAKFIKTGSDDNWNDWFLREKDTAKSELELFTKRKIQELGAEPNKYISGALGQLELQLNRTSWETYLSDAQIIGLADDMVHLAVKKNYIADMINKRLQRVIAKVMSDCIGKKVSVTAHSMEVKSDTPHFLTNQQYASAS